MRVDRVHFIIADADKAAANQLAAVQNPTPVDPAVDNFPTGLSIDGHGPATYWWAAAPVSAEFVARLPVLRQALPESFAYQTSGRHTRASILAAHGLRVITDE